MMQRETQAGMVMRTTEFTPRKTVDAFSLILQWLHMCVSACAFC